MIGRTRICSYSSPAIGWKTCFASNTTPKLKAAILPGREELLFKCLILSLLEIFLQFNSSKLSRNTGEVVTLSVVWFNCAWKLSFRHIRTRAKCTCRLPTLNHGCCACEDVLNMTELEQLRQEAEALKGQIRVCIVFSVTSAVSCLISRLSNRDVFVYSNVFVIRPTISGLRKWKWRWRLMFCRRGSCGKRGATYFT